MILKHTMQLAAASVCLAVLLLVVDELCAHPENSVRRAARRSARQGVRDVARVGTCALPAGARRLWLGTALVRGRGTEQR